MIIRFIAFALTLLLLTPGSVLSDEVARPSKPRAAKRAVDPQQQAMERAKRCQDAVNDAQAAAVGTSVLSSAVGFLPFGGSGVANAAANMGASAAGEIARQKAAASVQGNCGG